MRKYRDLTIRERILIFNILFFTAMLVIFMFLFFEVRRSTEETTIAAERLLMGQTVNTIELVSEEAGTIADSIASQPLLYRMVNTQDLDRFLEENDTAVYARDFFSEIETVEKSEMLSGIRIYLSPEYDKVGQAYSFSEVFRPISEVRSAYWYGIFAGRPLLYAQFCPAFYLTGRDINDYVNVAYIRRLTLTGRQNSEVGYIAVYFQTDYLKKLLLRNQPEAGSVYYLINSRESIVASTDEELSGIYHIDYEDIPDYISAKEEYEQVVLSGGRLYAAYNNISNTDWRLLSFIPVESIYLKEQGRIVRQFGFLLLLFVATVTMELLFSRNISTRLIRVAERMRPGPGAPLTTIPEERTDDEIGQLVHTYNQMVERISALVESERETADKLKVSEVNALQSQINPHFLYNMLDMINWQALRGESELVSQAVQSLSRFYRLVLSGKDILIPIGDELRHVELYLKLQNMRYENKINFIIDVPDELLECRIPKLVLQPMVENSLLHGIFEKETPSGTVVIMAWEEVNSGTGRDDIVLTVSDDGVGISDEKLSDLKQVLAAAAKGEELFGKVSGKARHSGAVLSGSTVREGSNVAVYNTEQRLVLLFGPDYGLTYRKNEPQGTEVEIRIPKQ